MAQIITITNPLTGQPAKVDQLEHTAQQIDDAITRALPGGAIDITLANNDPRRWGLGTSGSPNIQDNDINNLTDNGWYYITGKPKNSPVTYGVIHVSARTQDDLVQTIFSFDDSCQSILRRNKVWGTWKPDEWVNPPMQLGVEYRTTEQYMGKPVYRKMVWGGALPNSGYSSVDIASGCVIVQAVCYATSAKNASEYSPSTISDVIPWNNNEGDGINMNAFKNHVYLWCKINRSSSNFVAYLWYIKDTD